MGKRDRQRRPARQRPHKDPKPVILVVCEGAVTEPEYLHGFARLRRNPRVRIEIKSGQGVPKTIVDFAKQLKRDAETRAKREKDVNLRYDQVWCVFDVDEHPNIPDAKQKSIANGLELAISNPCIELWLLLHFQDQPGMRHRDELQSMMKEHVPGYCKHVNYSEHYATGYNDAVKRASRLDEMAELDGEEGRNPTSGFWRLTKSIEAGS